MSIRLQYRLQSVFALVILLLLSHPCLSVPVITAPPNAANTAYFTRGHVLKTEHKMESESLSGSRASSFSRFVVGLSSSTQISQVMTMSAGISSLSAMLASIDSANSADFPSPTDGGPGGNDGCTPGFRKGNFAKAQLIRPTPTRTSTVEPKLTQEPVRAADFVGVLQSVLTAAQQSQTQSRQSAMNAAQSAKSAANQQLTQNHMSEFLESQRASIQYSMTLNSQRSAAELSSQMESMSSSRMSAMSSAQMSASGMYPADYPMNTDAAGADTAVPDTTANAGFCGEGQMPPMPTDTNEEGNGGDSNDGSGPTTKSKKSTALRAGSPHYSVVLLISLSTLLLF
jgi:hypothetical protein